MQLVNLVVEIFVPCETDKSGTLPVLFGYRSSTFCKQFLKGIFLKIETFVLQVPIMFQ